MIGKLLPATALAALLAAPVFAERALADQAPPADAMALSAILQTLEQEPGFAYIDEVDWDDDGYYEVEYYMTDGRKIEVKLDPTTGQPR